MENSTNRALAQTLFAAGPHPSLGAHADTYSRVIGSWTGELHNHMHPDTKPASIEVHFGWVLEGRAVQDVWITPARADRETGKAPFLNWYGTTLRVFDPQTGTWRACWWDPLSQLQIELEGRRQGGDIVQVGTRGRSTIRWTFTDIQPSAFHWQGHILEADAKTWRLEVDIRLRRAA